MERRGNSRAKGAALAAVLVLLAVLPARLASQQDAVKIEASAQPRRLMRGEEGKIRLQLRVPKGTYLSVSSFLIEFTPLEDVVLPKTFFTVSDLRLEVLEESGVSYLNVDAPIEIPFTVSPEARRGSHILRGRVKYIARSIAGGWCLKSSAKFSVSLATSPLAKEVPEGPARPPGQRSP
jgi:hypothetical protein